MKEYQQPNRKRVSSGTGGRREKYRDKKLSQIGGEFTATKVSDKDKRTEKRRRGGTTSIKVKKASSVNVITKEGKAKKAKIIKLLESHNPEYVRMNIITKGAVLETDLGKVRVTNRVGQDGVVNGVLV
jgi:small subunit ribosomal protein S8e